MSSNSLPVPEALDARAPVGFRTQPHNIDAEQALLGAILVNNEAYHRVGEYLRPEHFYEPVHGRIFEAMTRLIEAGRIADHVTLKVAIRRGRGPARAGRAQYLARLARAAETILNAEDYGRLLHDLALRRGLIHVGEATVNKAFDPTARRERPRADRARRAAAVLLAQEGEVEGGFRALPSVLTSTVTMVEAAYHKDSRITGVPTGLHRPRRQARRPAALRPGDPGRATEHGQDRTGGHDRRQCGGEPRGRPRCRGSGERELHRRHLLARDVGRAARHASALGGAKLSSDDLRRGKLKESDFKAVVQASQELASRPLYIDDTPALSVAALRTRARRLKRRHGLSLLVVDYLQLVRPRPAPASTTGCRRSPRSPRA